jgi:hypothetical protein
LRGFTTAIRAFEVSGHIQETAIQNWAKRDFVAERQKSIGWDAFQRIRSLVTRS